MIIDRSEELKALDSLPELKATPFPFLGHRDFRRFTQTEHDNFVGGLFQKVSNPKECKWIGGKARLLDALVALTSRGYVVEVTGPHISEISNEADGYGKVSTRWFTLRFTAKTRHKIPNGTL